jgi:GntR family transcriptional regulator, carbon starvation induced regulator
MKPARGRAPGERVTSATLVYRELKRDLLRGLHEPGSRLQVEATAQRYGVSTNPVREALNRLAAERLVDREDQRGFSVPALSLDHFRELVKTRCWLEGRALAESIAHRSEAWEDGVVLALHRLLRTPFVDGARVDVAVDNSAWESRHRQFHLALIANCGSHWLMRFCEEMMDQAERYRYISDIRSFPRRDAPGEHRLIAEAALAGDADLAVERLSAQYELTLSLYESQVRDVEGEERPEASGAEGGDDGEDDGRDARP